MFGVSTGEPSNQLQALADNQRFQVEAAYLTLASNVAVAAITEASLRGQIDAALEIIAINKKMLDILRKQLQTGYANRNDVALQEAALAQVEATLPPLRKALQQNRDLLAALTGAYASEDPREKFKLADLQLPIDLPVSVPSQMIEQRPDVRAAQETLHAASASIGIATADMLPTFTITGESRLCEYHPCRLDQSGEWISGSSPATRRRRCSMVASCCMICAARAQPMTRRPGAIKAPWSAPCRTSPIRCAPLQNDADSLKAARDFERAAKISLDLAQQQMQTGYANILILLTAQQTYLQADTQVVQARAARLADTAALYQALGRRLVEPDGAAGREGP